MKNQLKQLKQYEKELSEIQKEMYKAEGSLNETMKQLKKLGIPSIEEGETILKERLEKQRVEEEAIQKEVEKLLRKLGKEDL